MLFLFKQKNVYLFFFLLFFTFLACDHESETEPRDVGDPPPPQFQQYGVPFDQVPATEDITMYEVNPRVFSPSGDLDGITARLDSLKKLGVNVVWLMPTYPTGDERSVGSPYAIKDYMAVNSDYGTLEDLRQLVDKAHALEMAVILDWVANHTAWDHEWINTPSWYVRDPNGNIIHPPGTNWMDVAELNYANQDMRREMIRAMKYWVLEANVDGYRCDFASGAPVSFWKAAIDTLRSIPDRDIIMFAESDVKELLEADFDMIFGWPFYGKLREVFNNGQSASQLYGTHLDEYSGLNPGQHIVRWISNHDENAWDNTPIHIFQNEKGAIAAFVIACYMGGVPLVYNGQEVAESQQLPFFEGHNVKIDWSQNQDIQKEYQQILQFRNRSEAIRRGNLRNYSSPDVAAFSSQSGEEEVLVIVNVRNSSKEFSLPESFRNASWENALSDSEIQLSEIIRLNAYEYYILVRRG